MGPRRALAVPPAEATSLIRRPLATALLIGLVATSPAGCSLSNRPKPIPPPPNTDTTPDTGSVGTPITIRGSETELEVRLTRVLDPVSGSPGDVTLDPGARFVGIELTLRNIGDRVYSESPLAGARLLLAGGRKADGVNLLGGPCGGRFPLHVGLRPGEKASGCMPFEVPGNRRPTRFLFRLDSGFGTEIGTWRLP
ncbi:MAG TPA: hypothetical protein VKA88_01800 [Solirubrobacterales bacterium]|nr:hypothetical protein [Solirubrobacterales bacterium]